MAFTHLMTSVLPSLRVPSTARVQLLADVVFGRKRHIFYAYLYLFILTSCIWSLGSVMIYDLFVSCLMSSFYRLRKQLLDSQHAIVGGMSVSSLTPDEKQLISSRYMTQCVGNIPDTVQTFYRLQQGNSIFYSKRYGKVKKRNSYTVLFKNTASKEQFGQILYFLLIDNLPFAVLQPFAIHTNATDHFNLPQPDCTPLNSKLFIVPQESDINYVAVPVNHIISKSVFVDIGSHNSYVICFPTHLTID